MSLTVCCISETLIHVCLFCICNNNNNNNNHNDIHSVVIIAEPLGEFTW